VEDILQVRMMLEQQSANLAAQRITEDQARTLRAHVKQLDLRTGRLEDDTKAHLSIRRLIAEASHNPLMQLFIEALSISAIDVIRTHIESTETVRETIDQTSVIKGQLVEAIIACDRYEAQRLARADVELQIQGFKDANLSSLSAPPSNWNGTSIKLPQLVAMKISQHIADNKLVEGDRLGSEPDLQERFGVSRSVLREAIRMLESFAVVRMRRGFGGGLTVGQPDPSSTVASAVRFLRSMGVEWRHLFEIREVLELGAVGLAARHASAAQVARLRDAFHAEMVVAEDENPVPVMTNVHKLISETGGNNVLSLITKVVIDTTAASYTHPPSREMARRVHESHHAVILAIVDHDESMARRRIYNHLLLLGTMGYDLSQVFGDNDDFSSVLTRDLL
jgi:DNA-binding FadR family transcriptional regulator